MRGEGSRRAEQDRSGSGAFQRSGPRRFIRSAVPADRTAGPMPSPPPQQRTFATRAVAAAGVLLAVMFVLAAGAPMYTADAFWHVASGDWLRAHGLGAQPDPFSFTAQGERWVLHEWLFQVVVSLVHEFGGMYGLRALTAAMAALILLQIAALWRRQLGGSTVAAVAGIAAFAVLGTVRIQTRPSLFTIAAVLLLVALWTRRGPWRWRDGAAVVLTQVLWVNAHSVALLGPILYAAFGCGRAADDWVARRGGLGDDAPQRGDLRAHCATWLLMALSTLATPAGVHVWEFAWQDKGSVMQFVVDEWAPFRPAFADNPLMPRSMWLGVWAVFAVLLLCGIAVAKALDGERDKLRSPCLPVPSRVALALALFMGGLMARRFVWFHALTLLFCIEALLRCARAGAFAGLAARLRGARVHAAAAAALALFALATAWFGLAVEGRPLPLAFTTSEYWTRPMAASFELPGVDFLAEAGIEGNAVCHYNSGGILSYRLFPKVRVLMDSRIDLYRRAIFLDYLAVQNGRLDQQQLLDHYGADIYYRHWHLPRPVDRSAWLRVWSGPDGDVWLRRGAERTAANLERARAWHERHGSALPDDDVGPPQGTRQPAAMPR